MPVKRLINQTRIQAKTTKMDGRYKSGKNHSTRVTNFFQNTNNDKR